MTDRESLLRRRGLAVGCRLRIGSGYEAAARDEDEATCPPRRARFPVALLPPDAAPSRKETPASRRPRLELAANPGPDRPSVVFWDCWRLRAGMASTDLGGLGAGSGAFPVRPTPTGWPCSFPMLERSGSVQPTARTTNPRLADRIIPRATLASWPPDRVLARATWEYTSRAHPR